MKMTLGEFFLASANSSLTRAAPLPTNNSTNSLAATLKNGTLASPATAFASKVFPVPGGPTSKHPVGNRPRTFLYLSADFSISTAGSLCGEQSEEKVGRGGWLVRETSVLGVVGSKSVRPDLVEWVLLSKLCYSRKSVYAYFSGAQKKPPKKPRGFPLKKRTQFHQLRFRLVHARDVGEGHPLTGVHRPPPLRLFSSVTPVLLVRHVAHDEV